MSRKNEYWLVSIAFIIILLITFSNIYIKSSQDSISSITNKIENLLGFSSNQNFSNSSFIPLKEPYEKLDLCNLEIKQNKNEIEKIPVSQNNQINPSFKLERVTFKTKDDLSQKQGGIDLACISFEPLITQLKQTLKTTNDQNPAKLKEVFGLNYDELIKLDKHDLYRNFLIKREAKDVCLELNNIKEVSTLQTKVQDKFDSKYVECIYKNTDNNGEVSRTVKFKYFIDKQSQFLLQIGESDADIIQKELLLINKVIV
jgi:hypothetical protein